jgi:hypothetical protein
MEAFYEDDMYYIISSENGLIIGLDEHPSNPRPRKKRKLNPTGENVYLLSDGTLRKDEDHIVAAQRIWKKRAYAPTTGVMYKKVFENFNLGQQS